MPPSHSLVTHSVHLFLLQDVPGSLDSSHYRYAHMLNRALLGKSCFLIRTATLCEVDCKEYLLREAKSARYFGACSRQC